MTSLRRRLLVGTAAATAVVFLAAAVSLYWLARHFLIKEFDGGQLTKAQMISTWIEFAGDRIGVDGGDLRRFPEFVDGKVLEYYRIRTDDGRVARSPTLKNAGDPALAEQSTPAFVTLPDGRRGRALTIRTQPILDPDEIAPGAALPTVWITVARATTDLDRLLMRLRWLLATVCGIGALILLVASAWVIRRGLAPIDSVARQIGAIGAADLDERFDLARVPRELTPIVSRLNELLARLQSAFEREKCFTADAAHELRTPLAGLETALEVCASQPRDTPRYQQVVGDCLKVVRQMHAMVDNLLLLARGDADRVPANREAIDVGEMLIELWPKFQPTADARRLCVQMKIDDDVIAQADPDMLTNIVNNLLDNAVQYTDESGRIEISASSVDSVAKISVTNTAGQMKPTDSEKVFDRFWRGDTARAAGRHAGLGLAVCQKLSTAMGAKIIARATAGGMFAVELDLPAGAKSPRCSSQEAAGTAATTS